MEEWRDIKGYEGLYKISSYGRVYSYHKRDTLKLNYNNKNGYYSVKLSKSNICKKFLVHRLVAESFIPNPNNYPQVNHKDENKQNNYVDNLEWCTAKYNCNYGGHNEKLSKSLKGRVINEDWKRKLSLNHRDTSGSKNPMYGKTYSKHPYSRKVQCITTGKTFDCIKEAGKYYFLNESVTRNITLCCRGKYKYSGKHPVTGEKLVWRYIND